MMPVSRYKNISRLLLCALLPAFNAQAEAMQSMSGPSMAFLEYLGGVENEIDGQLSSPVDLDLEAALFASSDGNSQAGNRQIDKVKAGSEEGANE